MPRLTESAEAAAGTAAIQIKAAQLARFLHRDAISAVVVLRHRWGSATTPIRAIPGRADGSFPAWWPDGLWRAVVAVHPDCYEATLVIVRRNGRRDFVSLEPGD